MTKIKFIIIAILASMILSSCYPKEASKASPYSQEYPQHCIVNQEDIEDLFEKISAIKWSPSNIALYESLTGKKWPDLSNTYIRLADPDRLTGEENEPQRTRVEMQAGGVRAVLTCKNGELIINRY